MIRRLKAWTARWPQTASALLLITAWAMAFALLLLWSSSWIVLLGVLVVWLIITSVRNDRHSRGRR